MTCAFARPMSLDDRAITDDKRNARVGSILSRAAATGCMVGSEECSIRSGTE